MSHLHCLPCEAPLVSRPTLVLVEDCDSVNMTSRWFMLYRLACRSVFLQDPLHNVWNDVLNSLKSCNEFKTVLLTGLSSNSAWGPWGGERWFRLLQESAAECAKTMGGVSGTDALQTDALLTQLAPRILCESGAKTIRACQALSREQMCSEAAEVMANAGFLRQKGVRIQTARWFSWMASMEALLLEWSAKTLVLCYTVIMSGLLSPKDVSRQLTDSVRLAGGNVERDGGAGSAAGQAEQPSGRLGNTPAESSGARDGSVGHVQRDKAAMQRFRDSCHNTVEAIALVHLSEHLHIGACAILHATRPFHEWQGQVSSRVRSTSTNSALHCSLVRGQEVLATCHAVLTSPGGGMESVGYFVSDASDEWRKLRAGVGNASLREHPLVLSQNQIVGRQGRLAVALVARRIITLSQYWVLPLRLFGLLDPETRADTVEDMLELRRAWSACEEQAGRYWGGVRECSCFQWQVNKELMEALPMADTAEGYDVPDEVLEFLACVSKSFSHTKVVEDAFCAARRHESSLSNKQQGGTSFYWARTVCDEVLNKLYQYVEVSPSNSTLQPMSHERWKGHASQKNLYEACPQEASAAIPELKEIMAHRRSWPSMTPGTACRVPAELELMKLCHQRGAWNEVGRTWRGGLFTPGLVVQKNGEESSWLVASVLQELLLVLWPVSLRDLGNGRVRWVQPSELRGFGDLRFDVCVSLADWTVVPTSWCSHLHITCLLGGHCREWPKCLLLVEGPPAPMLQHLARQGLLGVRAALLRQVLRSEEYQAVLATSVAASSSSAQEGAPVEGSANQEKVEKLSDFDVQLEIIKQTLKVDGVAAAGLMEEALLAESSLDGADRTELLTNEDVQGCFDATDQELLGQVGQEAGSQSRAATRRTIMTKISALREEAWRGKRARRRAVQIPHDATMTETEARKRLPPKARIWRDAFQGRWQVWLGKWSHSVSWGWHKTDHECITACLTKVWERHAAVTGQVVTVGG